VSRLPLPPQGKVDESGRPVHPYVRDPEPDASAPGYCTTRGDDISQEDRSRESRLAFHAIEGLLGHLTPLGYAHLIEAVIHRLYSPSLAGEIAAAGLTAEELDPRNELLPFEELHRTRLSTIAELVNEIVFTCPNCGRRHDEACAETLQPGAYVHTSSGDAVSVRRVAESKVYAVAQVDATGREVSRVYDREWFEQHFVPAGDVEVLGGPA
jgi:hypothetical protein